MYEFEYPACVQIIALITLGRWLNILASE